MAILLKTASVWVSSIQIMHVRVQNKGKSVWIGRYDGDVSVSLVHCVHKKGGIAVVPNDKDELIPQRIITGYGMVIDFVN